MNGFIGFCRRHLAAVLAGLVVVTALAGWLASSLTLDSNLTRLLPENAPSVVGLEALQDAYGGQIGRFSVVLQLDSDQSDSDQSDSDQSDSDQSDSDQSDSDQSDSDQSDSDRLEALADGLADRLAKLDSVRRVEAKRPTDFFEANRLLYADRRDLDTVKQRLGKRIQWEKKRANPLFVPLGDDEPPEVDFSDIADKYDHLKQSPYYVNEAGDKLAIFVYPDFPAGDLVKSKDLSKRMSRAIEDQLGPDSAVTYGLSGRYQKRVELQNTLTSDLGLATGVAVVVLILFLLVFLRSISGMIVVIVPLISGTILSLAWAYIAFGSLNILTGFLGAVLLGVGVDYGLHLYVRYHELSDQMGVEQALARTFATSGRANFFGGLTTAIALGSLTVTDFRAFYEFGVIALGGIALILVSYTLWLVCLMLVADQWIDDLPAPLSKRLAGPDNATMAAMDSPGWVRIGRRCAIGLALIVVAGAAGLPQVDFVRSLKPLQMRQSKAWQLDRMVNDMLGQSQTPTVILTDGADQSAEVVDEIRRRKKTRANGDTVDKVVSLQTLLPSEQPEKRKILADLADDLRDVPKGARSDKLSRYLSEVQAILDADALDADDLPVAVREPLRRKADPDAADPDASAGGVVLVFPAIDLANVNLVDRYVAMLRDLPGIDADGRYDAISEAMLLHDIVRLIERDAVWMVGITFVGLVLASFAAFRRRREVLLQLAILAAAFVSALGLAGWAGVELNFLNIVVMPIWLGLGIDASFHALMHLRDEPDHTGVHVATALAVGAAFLTTMIGFGSMLLAHHSGLRSLGEISVIGLAAILVVNVLAQFVLVGRQQRSEAQDGPSD